MLTRLRIINFKSFADTELFLGPFSVVVGTNASGKSNIRDAFRFLHGLGRGYSLADVIGGRYGAGGQAEWAQLRGAANEIIRLGENRFRFEMDMDIRSVLFSYVIDIISDERTRSGFRVVEETLSLNGGALIVYTSHPGGADPVERQDDEAHLLLRMAKTGEQRKYGERVTVRHDQPALTQIEEFQKVGKFHKDLARAFSQQLSEIRFLDLIPEQMRRPAFPGQTVLGDSGENLSTVLQEICSDPERKGVLLEWVRELTPMDVIDFEFPRDQITGLIQLVFREASGIRISAYSASDGTLRFLAMLAALLGSDPAALYFFEEIDNGIHPSRLRLLLDLIETQTHRAGIQVVTTTHSPDLLTMVGDATFESTSVVYRPFGSSAACIALVKNLPNAAMLREQQGLGRLHSSGWLEDALLFTAERPEAGAL